MDEPLTILQINTTDIHGGGAERIAWSLFQQYQAFGLQSWLVVGEKRSNDPYVLSIPNDELRNRWERLWQRIGGVLTPHVANVRGLWQLQTLLYGIGRPKWWVNIRRGYEDFDFPGTWRILDLLPQLPHIVHCHNLHGNYFDLNAVPGLSQQIPLLLTLHDEWLLSGHCAYSLDCTRWQTGCGACPYLKTYPAIQRDATAYNWQRKANIFNKSRLYVTTPSQWLMQRVEQSLLSPAVVKSRVIPNGVDLSVFRPANQQIVRAELGIPPDVKLFLFVANRAHKALWKDYQTIRDAALLVAESLKGQKLLFVALGERAPAERFGCAELWFVPYLKNTSTVASYYQAADIYLHAAFVDNFPTTVLEALACGIPVIATAVGGIPEQVKSLKIPEFGLPGYSPGEATGILVPPQDASAMARAINVLLDDEALRNRLGKNAAKDAHNRFDLNGQVKAYLAWYHDILQTYKGTGI